MAMVDYGVVVFKNGNLENKNEFFMDMQKTVGRMNETIYGRYFGFIGNETIALFFYMQWCDIFLNKEIVASYNGTLKREELKHKGYKKVLRLDVNGMNLCIKELYPNGYHASFILNGDHYHVIYGYGIDPDFSVWNQVKVRYLGKSAAKKVDNLFKKIRK